MGTAVIQLYRRVDGNMEYCFNIETTVPLEPAELRNLKLVLAEGFLLGSVAESPHLTGDRVVEVGPRLNFATAWSSNLVSICRAIGLDTITRVERSRRYLVPDDLDPENFAAVHHDRMTECVYPGPLSDFATGIQPEPVYEVDLMGGGPDALTDIPGISMDEWDRNFYYDYFVNRHRRNPTIVEIMDLNNANSEHSRHGFFKGKMVIDGQEQEKTLLQLVIETLEKNPQGSVIAFKDNSSGVRGHEISTLLPQKPGEPCGFNAATVEYHIIFTAETHNFPTGVAPFPRVEHTAYTCRSP